VTLGAVTAGECFGEMALLTAAPRSASVTGASDGVLLRFERQRFLQLFRDDSSLGMVLIDVLSQRLRRADARFRASDETVRAAAPHTAPAASQPAQLARTHAQPSRHEPAHRPVSIRAVAGMLGATSIMLAGWVVPPPSGLAPAGWHALATLLALVPMLALSGLPEGVVGLLLLATWVVCGVAPASLALSGFATGTRRAARQRLG